MPGDGAASRSADGKSVVVSGEYLYFGHLSGGGCVIPEEAEGLEYD